MDLLLDTHVWIWASELPEELGPETQAVLRDAENDLFVSAVSSLEIARLVAVGRVSIKGNLLDWVTESLAALSCKTAELSHEVALGAYLLPEEFHRDPADRILVSTARRRILTLVTADRRILEYAHVQTKDART